MKETTIKPVKTARLGVDIATPLLHLPRFTYGKGKVFSKHAKKACKGSGDKAPFTPNLGTGWGERSASRPGRFIPGKVAPCIP
jgi:hypothetical protein